MFGWEFPPFKSGGLGTACYDLTKGLSKQKVKTTFVMPFAPEDAKAPFVKLVGTNNIRIKQIDSIITGYMNYEQYEQTYQGLQKDKKQIYGKNIIEEVKRYAQIAKKIAKQEEHDIIHVHDWMTYEAGINAKKISKKPLVAHMHATEFDRTGGNPDPRISHIEYRGMNEADVVITNSEFSKQNILKHYKIPSEKIKVVHWGIDEKEFPEYDVQKPCEKTVLFLGRVTLQKGPDYFIETANKVLEFEPETKFIFAGDGDMMPKIINRASELGISDKIIFTGMLRGEEVHKAFQSADLYIMPSVSEPLGLVALEGMKNGTPILISKQSGASEVLNHALKTDFWDINEMTNKIVSVLRHDPLKEELTKNTKLEVKKFNLDEPARKVKDIYHEVLK